VIAGAVAASPLPGGEHASADEFADLISAVTVDSSYLQRTLTNRQAFVDRYPDLDEWFAQPLTCRVGRLRGEDPRRGPVTDPVSYNARHYLSFLGVTGRVAFDWEWLLAVPALNIWVHAKALELPLVIDAQQRLPKIGEQLGYRAQTARRAAQWALSRIMLHTAIPSLTSVSLAELDGLAEAIRDFGGHPDRAQFHGSDRQWAGRKMNWGSQLFVLQMLLFHTGQLTELPKEPLQATAVWPRLPPAMDSSIDRYLAARRQLDRPATMQNIELGLRRFTTWLIDRHPRLHSFAEVTRIDCQEFAVWLDTLRHQRTGAALASTTKRSDLQAVLGLFRDGAAWEWPDMPTRPLLIAGDLPKIPRAVPRFIPDHELAPLTDAIRALPCPYQRAALLVARWCGARRGEIRMLELDCLDAYPDRTPRLRIPAGKTYTERMVPLTDEAADAIREVQALRATHADRPLPALICNQPRVDCSPAKDESCLSNTCSTTRSALPAPPPDYSTTTAIPPCPRIDSGTPSAPNSPPEARGYIRS
jgi:site-specific recombinase XerD